MSNKFKYNNKLKKIQIFKVLNGSVLKCFGTEGLGFALNNVAIKLIKEVITLPVSTFRTYCQVVLSYKRQEGSQTLFLIL